jgi:hypothetical protein
MKKRTAGRRASRSVQGRPRARPARNKRTTAGRGRALSPAPFLPPARPTPTGIRSRAEANLHLRRCCCRKRHRFLGRGVVRRGESAGGRDESHPGLGIRTPPRRTSRRFRRCHARAMAGSHQVATAVIRHGCRPLRPPLDPRWKVGRTWRPSRWPTGCLGSLGAQTREPLEGHVLSQAKSCRELRSSRAVNRRPRQACSRARTRPRQPASSVTC